MDHISRKYVNISRTAKKRQLCFNTSQKLASFDKRKFFHRGLSPEIVRETFVFKTETILLENVKCTLYITAIMIMNCFCGMVDRQKAFSLIFNLNHCQKSTPSRICDTPRDAFQPAQNLSFAEWRAVVITTTPQRQMWDLVTVDWNN